MSLRDFDKNTMIISRRNIPLHERNNSFSEDKEQCRKVLAADIEAFLKAGGQITRVSDDESAYPERLKKYSFVPKDYKDAKI